MPTHHSHRFRGEPPVTTRPHGAHQRWRVLAASAIALGGVLVAPSQGAASVQPVAHVGPTTRVIVQAATGSLAAVESAAEKLGAHVVSTQKSLDTFVVDLPANLLDDLRHVPASAPRPGTCGSTSAASPASRARRVTSATSQTETGATDYWHNGFFGQGVDVALLDSGVLPVNGLTTSNKLVIGPDLSYESRSRSLRGLDTFGHGTHMAGIIAGLDDGLSPTSYPSTSDNFVGMAPGSRIVSLKLADAHGQTDVSQVIAGIGWVVEHAHDPGMNIRVLNLSFGTDAPRRTTASTPWRAPPRSPGTAGSWSSHPPGTARRRTAGSPARRSTPTCSPSAPLTPMARRTPTTTPSRRSPRRATEARASGDRTSWRPASPWSACAPRFVHRPDAEQGTRRRAVLQGQRHLTVGGCRLRRRRTSAVAAARAHTRPGP